MRPLRRSAAVLRASSPPRGLNLAPRRLPAPSDLGAGEAMGAAQEVMRVPSRCRNVMRQTGRAGDAGRLATSWPRFLARFDRFEVAHGHADLLTAALAGTGGVYGTSAFRSAGRVAEPQGPLLNAARADCAGRSSADGSPWTRVLAPETKARSRGLLL